MPTQHHPCQFVLHVHHVGFVLDTLAVRAGESRPDSIHCSFRFVVIFLLPLSILPLDLGAQWAEQLHRPGHAFSFLYADQFLLDAGRGTLPLYAGG